MPTEIKGLIEMVAEAQADDVPRKVLVPVVSGEDSRNEAVDEEQKPGTSTCVSLNIPGGLVIVAGATIFCTPHNSKSP
jgi:hypothetical protein